MRLVFEVDAARLADYELGSFDVAMFYFPHTGVPNNQREECVRSNRNLISGFLRSVQEVMADDGEVHLALKTNDIYASWNIEELIAHTGMKKTYDFELNKEEFPEYAHRMTLGSTGMLKQVQDRGARVYLCEPKEAVRQTFGVRRICDTGVRLRITYVDSETEAEVGVAVLTLLQDAAAPLDVLDIRSALGSRHDTRQLNRVLTLLVSAGQLNRVMCEKGKPKYVVGGSSLSPVRGSLKNDAIEMQIMELLAAQSGALDTLEVARAIGLSVQKDVRGVLQQLLDRGAVANDCLGISARPRWRVAGA